MDPHEIEMVMGYALEDFWGEEWEKRYRACVAEPRIDKRVISVKEIVRLILKSVVETGTPFAFYRDTVNRLNPNPQAGMIYCSNLCTEIAQNMSAVESVRTEIKTEAGDTVVQVTTRPGDFVVCNLASLNLSRIDVTSHEELRSVVRTAVRALDNVIDLNEAPLAYARLTNAKYRSIGLGVSGYHHMLAGTPSAGRARSTSPLSTTYSPASTTRPSGRAATSRRRRARTAALRAATGRRVTTSGSAATSRKRGRNSPRRSARRACARKSPGASTPSATRSKGSTRR